MLLWIQGYVSVPPRLNSFARFGHVVDITVGVGTFLAWCSLTSSYALGLVFTRWCLVKLLTSLPWHLVRYNRVKRDIMTNALVLSDSIAVIFQQRIIWPLKTGYRNNWNLTIHKQILAESGIESKTIGLTY